MSNKARGERGVADGVVEWHPTVKDLPQHERPRERLLQGGADSLSTQDLLAIILRAGVPGLPVTHLAERLLVKYRGLGGLARAPISALCEERGIGEAKAAQLKAALTLARRFLDEDPQEKAQVRSPLDAAELLRLEMQSLEQEQFRVLLLDTKNRVLAVRKLYDGTVNSSTIRVAEVFREAVRQNSPAIVAVHNHPSGDPTPSPEDVRVTEALIAGGKLLDVEVLDHIIIGHGHGNYVSLKQRGLAFR